MQNIREQEEALFKKFTHYSNELVKDGVVNPLEYQNSNPKILFILKEANRYPGGDLRAFLAKGGRVPTWKTVALWVYCLRQLVNDPNWSLSWNERPQDTQEFRAEQLKSIAFLNVKKISGGHTSDMKKVKEFQNKDADLLRQQIDIYDPDIVICGGTGCNLFENEWRENFTNRGISYSKIDKRIVINFYHPEVRVADNVKFYAFYDMIKEILK